MQIVADLMTKNLLTITAAHSMKNVHDLITKKGIRHIPIMSEDNTSMLGLITHKIMIAKVISLMTEYGSESLLEQEMKTSVMDIAVTDFDKVYVDDSLQHAAEYFLKNKNGCLPVFERQSEHDEKLVGMLSSSDFVKLSLNLLQAQ